MSVVMLMRAAVKLLKKLLDQPESTTFTSFNICCNVSERVAEKLFRKLLHQTEIHLQFSMPLIMKEKPEPMRDNRPRKKSPPIKTIAP